MAQSMADQMTDALIALDRNHARSTWPSIPNLSDRQIDRYIAREEQDMIHIYARYHAKRRYVRDSLGGKQYDLVLPDGSIYEGVIAYSDELDALEQVA